MRQSRVTEAPIVAALQQVKSGIPVTKICRTFKVTEATFCRWLRQLGGLGVSELIELQELREETASSNRS